MLIRHTKIEELDAVLAIYARARQFMRETGNPNQWGQARPAREQIEKDIREGNSYVAVEGDELAAVFFYSSEVDPTYNIIYKGAWRNDKSYGVVHRIAASGTVKGAGSFCLNWAYEQCGNLKIDTHQDNIVMQHTLKKNGFEYCGIIYLENGEERLAFQKVK